MILETLLSRKSTFLIFIYQTQNIKKIRKDEKVVLDLKKILMCLNEIKTECNISFFYLRSSELIDIMIEYYDLLNRY